jgi:hypothetical protein
MKGLLVCRHCGESFQPPQPPNKPIGRYVDECPECSRSLYIPSAPMVPQGKADASQKLLRNRRDLRRSLEKAGRTPSQIARIMDSVEQLGEEGRDIGF